MLRCTVAAVAFVFPLAASPPGMAEIGSNA